MADDEEEFVRQALQHAAGLKRERLMMMKRSVAAGLICWILSDPAELHAQPQTSSIGYATVEDARKALLTKPGVQTREQQGWLIADDRPEMTLWSFTPPGHEAYPAAIKRVIVQEGGAIFIEMTALCQAEKAPCDRLIDEFKKLNDIIRQNMQRKIQQ